MSYCYVRSLLEHLPSESKRYGISQSKTNSPKNFTFGKSLTYLQWTLLKSPKGVHYREVLL